MSGRRDVVATTPPDRNTLKIKKPKSIAAGIPAATSSMIHGIKKMGLNKTIKTLTTVNQPSGFDCPGCAWPDPEHSTMFEFCENGAKAVADEAMKGLVNPSFFARNSVEDLSLKSDYWLNKQGRITHPVILAPDSKYYEKISWKNAFDLIAKVIDESGDPNRSIFYTSGRTSNEAAFMYQLFARTLGTNNMPDCSNMCHESSGTGLGETIGIGKGTVSLDDFNHSELVIVMGQNPGTNHPRMLTALGETKKRGGKIITINPLPEVGLMRYNHPQNPIKWIGKGQKLTDIFLQVKINGDVALLKIILKLLWEKEQENPNSVFDHQFIASKTLGYDDFIKDLEKTSIEELIPQTGIDFGTIKEATELIAQKKKIIICWAMGLTQHKNSVDNIRELVNLLLLKGSIGKQGAGTCPVRGHSNVQGDRTMGIWEKPEEAFLDNLEKEFNFKAPRNNGYDVVDAIEAMHQQKARVFIGMGGNFLSATPDTEYTAEALQNCKLTVQVSTKLNRSHLIHGKKALILPCLGRSEKDIQEKGVQFVSVENSMGVVQSSSGPLKPLSEFLLSEPAIVVGIAKASLVNSTIKWSEFTKDYDSIRDKIEATIPGFKNYNERIRIKGGFYLPNTARNKDFTPTLTGKANFSINFVSDIVLKIDQLIMMTIRTHDQYNTTIYGLDDRYRGVLNERRVIFMNPDDIKQRKLKKLDKVNLISHYKGEERIARSFLVIPYNIPKQCTATYFPEANVLVPLQSKARISNTPTSKTVIITVHKQ